MAGLVPQILNVPLFGGQDSSIDQKLLEPGSNAIVENFRLSKRGQAQKRYGYQNAGMTTLDATTITAGMQIFQAGRQLLHHDGATLRTYIPSLKNWRTLGDHLAGQITAGGIVQTLSDVTEQSSANSATITVTAWVELSGLYVTVTDRSSGTGIIQRQLVDAFGLSPIVCQLNGDFYLFYATRTPSNAFVVRLIRGAAPSLLTSAVAVPGVSPDYHLGFDVTTDPTGNRLLGIFNAAGTLAQNPGAFSVYSISPALVFTFIVTRITTSVPKPWVFSVGPLAAGGYFYHGGGYFHMVTAGGADQASYDPEIAKVTSLPSGYVFAEVQNVVTPDVGTATAPQIVGIQVLFCDPNNTSPRNNGKAPLYATTGNFRLATKAFTYKGMGYVWIVSDTGFQSQYFLLNQNGNIVGQALSDGLAAPYDGKGTSLPQVSDDGKGNFDFTVRYRQALSFTAAGVAFTTIGLARRSLALGAQHTYAYTLEGTTYMSGPAPKIYDGTATSEWGFWYYPEFVGKPAVTPGNGSLAGGTYTVAAVYAWYDATGKLWRSAVAPLLTATATVPSVAAGSSISVTVPYLQTTQHQNVFIEFYCAANVAGQTGVVLYKVGQVTNQTNPFPGVADPVFYNANVLGIAPQTSATFRITLADTVIQSGEPLYTTNNYPENITPPPLNYLASSSTRLYGLSAEVNQVLVTNTSNPGQPLNYNPIQAVLIPSAATAPNSMAIMDGLMFVATGRKWLATNADTNDLSQPIITFQPMRELPFDSGVTSPSSVLLGMDGIYYQSGQGITLLSRSESLVFAGEPVKDNQAPVTDGFELNPAQQIRFLQGGKILNWDHKSAIWTQSAFASQLNVVSTCRWNDAGAILTSDGIVRIETPGVYFDDSLPIVCRLETAWIKPSNLHSTNAAGATVPGSVAGWGQCWRFLILGERRSAHTLRVRIAYDFDAGWIDDLQVSSEALVNGAGTFGSGLGTFGNLTVPGFGNNAAGTAYQAVGVMPRRKASAYKFEISDINSTGEDFALNVLALLIGVRPGLSQVPTWKKMG